MRFMADAPGPISNGAARGRAMMDGTIARTGAIPGSGAASLLYFGDRPPTAMKDFFHTPPAFASSSLESAR